MFTVSEVLVEEAVSNKIMRYPLMLENWLQEKPIVRP